MSTQVSRLPQLRGNHTMSIFDVDYADNEFVAKISAVVPSKSFDPVQYSQFKYGRRDIARFYATDIFVRLLKHLWAISDHDEPLVITGTPFKRIPNAARILAAETYRMIRRNDPSVSLASIYQPRLAAGDYGTLGSAARHKRNLSKKRYLDPQDFEGKHVVLIDDVRITGSIERSTVAQLKDLDVLSITTVNLVRFNPETALAEPHLEDKLNHFKVASLDDLWSLMVYPQDNFVLTTRAIKYILQADSVALQKFLKLLSAKRLNELFQGIVDEGYDQMADYQRSFEQVLDALDRRPSH